MSHSRLCSTHPIFATVDQSVARDEEQVHRLTNVDGCVLAVDSTLVDGHLLYAYAVIHETSEYCRSYVVQCDAEGNRVGCVFDPFMHSDCCLFTFVHYMTLPDHSIHIAAGCANGNVYVFDAFDVDGPPVYDETFSTGSSVSCMDSCCWPNHSSGIRVAIGSKDGTVREFHLTASQATPDSYYDTIGPFRYGKDSDHEFSREIMHPEHSIDDLNGITCVSYTPPIFDAKGDFRIFIVSGGNDGTVRVWDTNTGDQVTKLIASAPTGLTPSIASLCVCPKLIDGGAEIILLTNDGQIVFWNTAYNTAEQKVTGKTIGVCENWKDNSSAKVQYNHDGTKFGVFFTQNNNQWDIVFGPTQIRPDSGFIVFDAIKAKTGSLSIDSVLLSRFLKVKEDFASHELPTILVHITDASFTPENDVLAAFYDAEGSGSSICKWDPYMRWKNRLSIVNLLSMISGSAVSPSRPLKKIKTI